jgi:hypothetical protein
LKHLIFERNLPGPKTGRREAAKDGTAAISVNISMRWLEPLFHPRPRRNPLQQSRLDDRSNGQVIAGRSWLVRSRVRSILVDGAWGLGRLNGYGVAHDEVPTSTVRPRSFSV